MRRLTVITGSFPPDVCGCGDYTQAVVRALQHDGVEVTLFFKRDWSLRHLFPYIKEIRGGRPEVINLQYPTQGYGWSIVPPLLCLFLGRIRKIITLHEFSHKRLLAKMAIYIFFVVADWLIFTTEAERSAAIRVAPWVRRRSSVVSIGSNIPFSKWREPNTDIIYFGLIHPTKGLEAFRQTLSCLGIGNLSVRVVGQIAPNCEAYANTLLPQLESLGIEIHLNRSAEEVSRMLSGARIAFLPFPDGMSRRRGSALAAMGNGALLVTTIARADTELFREICAMPIHGSSLCELLTDVLTNSDSYESIRVAGQKFAQSLSWQGIATEYIRIMDTLLSSDS